MWISRVLWRKLAALDLVQRTSTLTFNDDIVQRTSTLTFNVNISKLDGVPLGAALRRHDGGSLLISAISVSGSIAEWNEKCPEKRIRPGDMIIAINGDNSDLWTMVKKMWSVGEITLTIQRDQSTLPEVHRTDSREYLVEEGRKMRRTKLKLHCPVDDLPHKSAGDCDGTVCAICFEDYEDTKTNVVVLPCNHAFHRLCAARWFSQGARCCPLCKQSIGESDEVKEEPSSDTSEVNVAEN
jgi:hypothetical protein